MTGFVLRRLARTVLTLWVTVTVVFVGLRLAGDPALQIASLSGDPEAREHFRAYLGLDRSLPEQYFTYLAGMARGEFGVSFLNGAPAVQVVAERLPKTLALGAASFLLSLAVGIPAGIAAALWPGSVIDRLVALFAVAFQAIPNFVFGIVLIFLFAYTLSLLPSSGSQSLRHLVLPTLTLGLTWAGIIARFTRSTVLDCRDLPHVRAAEARGLGPRRVLVNSVLRNAAVPVILVCGFIVGGILGGAVVTEMVFAWPGIGRLIVSSVAIRDLPVIQTVILVAAFAMSMANLLADLLAAAIDARLRQR